MVVLRTIIAVVLLGALPLRAEHVPLGADGQLDFGDRTPPSREPLRVALRPGDIKPSTQRPHPAVARIIAPEGRNTLSLGSGTLIDANDTNGLVVTNWHVVKDARGPVEVVFPDGFRSTARVLRMDKEWDLAALLIAKPNAQPVQLAGQAPQPGQWLTIAGYGSGNYRAASGKCTQYLAPGARRPFEILEVSAAARQGDSGGPIFNERGELAGVLFGEGGGRTSGSYVGRVHQFLLLAAAEMPRAPNNTQEVIAARQPRQSIPGNKAADSWARDISIWDTPRDVIPQPIEVQRACQRETPPVAIQQVPPSGWGGTTDSPGALGEIAPQPPLESSGWSSDLPFFFLVLGAVAAAIQLLHWLAAVGG